MTAKVITITNQKGGARKRKSGKTMKKIRKNKNKKSKRNH